MPTTDPGSWAVRLGPLVFSVWIAKSLDSSFGGGGVGTPCLLTHKFQAQPHRCSCRAARHLRSLKDYRYRKIETSAHSSDITYSLPQAQESLPLSRRNRRNRDLLALSENES